MNGTLVVVDASTFFAAAHSPSGGSATALALIRHLADYQAAASDLILEEARRNLARKSTGEALARFHNWRTGLQLVIASAAPIPADLPSSIAEKDHHVMSVCLALDATICLTLDRQHLLTDEVRAWGEARGLLLQTPGDILAHVRRADSER